MERVPPGVAQLNKPFPHFPSFSPPSREIFSAVFFTNCLTAETCFYRSNANPSCVWGNQQQFTDLVRPLVRRARVSCDHELRASGGSPVSFDCLSPRRFGAPRFPRVHTAPPCGCARTPIVGQPNRRWHQRITCGFQRAPCWTYRSCVGPNGWFVGPNGSFVGTHGPSVGFTSRSLDPTDRSLVSTGHPLVPTDRSWAVRTGAGFPSGLVFKHLT